MSLAKISEDLSSELSALTTPNQGEITAIIAKAVTNRFKAALIVSSQPDLLTASIQDVDNKVKNDPLTYLNYGKGPTELVYLQQIAVTQQQLRANTVNILRQEVERSKIIIDTEIDNNQASLDVVYRFTLTKNALPGLEQKIELELNRMQRLINDPACKPGVQKKGHNLLLPSNRDPDDYFKQEISPINIALPVDLNSLVKTTTWLNPTEALIDANPGDVAAQSVNTNLDRELLKRVVANCYLHGNGTAVIQNKINDVRQSLADMRTDLIRVAYDVGGLSGSLDLVQRLSYYGNGIADQIREKHKDFSLMNEIPVNYFVGGPNTVGGGLVDKRKFSRRIYAALLSRIFGQINHASIPFSTNIQLYDGLAISPGGFLGDFSATEVAPKQLNQRVARLLLVKELRELTDNYADILYHYYQRISLEDRQDFENGPATNFNSFIKALKDIMARKSVGLEYSDLTKTMPQVYQALVRDFLPNEIVSMMDKYPSNHPKVILEARAHIEPMPINVPPAPASARTDGPNRNRIIAKYVTLPDFATPKAESIDLAIELELNRLAVRVGAGLPALALFTPPALVVPRLEVASTSAVLTGEDVKLAPMWIQLQNEMRTIEARAERVFFYLSLLLI